MSGRHHMSDDIHHGFALGVSATGGAIATDQRCPYRLASADAMHQLMQCMMQCTEWFMEK